MCDNGTSQAEKGTASPEPPSRVAPSEPPAASGHPIPADPEQNPTEDRQLVREIARMIYDEFCEPGVETGPPAMPPFDEAEGYGGHEAAMRVAQRIVARLVRPTV